MKAASSRPKADLKLSVIIKQLEARESAHDQILAASRPLIRLCAMAIKLLHAGEMAAAKKELAALDAGLAKLPPANAEWDYLRSPILQEAVEARLLLAAVQRKPLPHYQQLQVPPQVYLLGLCDAVGEFRRQMLESLKRGDRRAAAYYFDLMNDIHDQLSVVRFSNSLLPNFRKKQDVARHQVEQARSELLRH